MRYLYGDLSEFPAQENTLDLLKRFIEMAVEVLKLDLEIDSSLENIEQDRQFLVETLGDIDRFHDTLHETIQTTSSGLDPNDVVHVIAQGAAEQLKQYIGDGKGRLIHQVEQRIGRTEGLIASLSSRIHGFLKGFFVPSVLPVGGNTLRCALDGQQYQAFSEILDITGTRCSYTINTAASSFFCEAKKFSDLFPGKMEFPVGTKKAWLKKAPVTETLRIDDAILSQIVDEDETGEFRLTKRAGNGVEGLLVRIKKGRNGGILVFRITPSGQEVAVPEEVLNPSHTEALQEFWRQLYPSVVELYRTRGDLSSISIDEKEVVQGRLVTELVGRLVRYLAPTVREIDSRSPAVEELCLKVEHEGGRREEIYIQKSDLLKRISELPESRQQFFSPLGFESVRIEPVEEVESFEEGPTEPGNPTT